MYWKVAKKWKQMINLFCQNTNFRMTSKPINFSFFLSFREKSKKFIQFDKPHKNDYSKWTYEPKALEKLKYQQITSKKKKIKLSNIRSQNNCGFAVSLVVHSRSNPSSCDKFWNKELHKGPCHSLYIHRWPLSWCHLCFKQHICSFSSLVLGFLVWEVALNEAKRIFSLNLSRFSTAGITLTLIHVDSDNGFN